MNINFLGHYVDDYSYSKLDAIIYQDKFFVSISDSNLGVLPNMSMDTQSWALWNENSNFPVKIDSFIEFQNLHATDIGDYNRFQALTMKSRRNPSEDDELSSLTTKLRNKLPLAEDFNKLSEAITTIQAFFKSNVEGFINQKQIEFQNEINKFIDRGSYNSDTQYYAKNFVHYNDGTGVHTFICNKNCKGIEPANIEYWTKLTIKGDKGVPGVGLVWRGAWDSEFVYEENDLIQHGGVLFGSLQTNTNKEPDMTQGTQYWERAIDITVTVAKLKGYRNITHDAKTVNFMTGDIVAFNPLIDDLEVFLNSTALDEGIDYIIEPDNQQIRKNGGEWLSSVGEPNFFSFRVTRNQINDLVFSDGQSIANGTISESKLSTDVREKIRRINVSATEPENTTPGDFWYEEI